MIGRIFNGDIATIYKDTTRMLNAKKLRSITKGKRKKPRT